MAYTKLTIEEKATRKEARAIARKERKKKLRILEEQTQKPVKKITFNIEWKKSRMWGTNPHLEAEVLYKDGRFNVIKATCSGCGYDKLSEVIADVFNQTLKYKLWMKKATLKEDELQKAPYGISYNYGNNLYYAGSIGVNCYFDIAKFIGGEFKQIASGSTFDVFTYEDKE